MEANATALDANYCYTVKELAYLWNLSDESIRRLFEEEPGVLILLCHIAGALLRVHGFDGSSSFPVAVFENPVKLRDVRGPRGE